MCPPSFAAQQECGEVEEVFDGLLDILFASVFDSIIDLAEYRVQNTSEMRVQFQWDDVRHFWVEERRVTLCNDC